jgi:hypothetical protein
MLILMALAPMADPIIEHFLSAPGIHGMAIILFILLFYGAYAQYFRWWHTTLQI